MPRLESSIAFGARRRRSPGFSILTSCKFMRSARTDGRPYLVLEFVAGESLARRIAGAPQPARVTAGLVASLARAIHAAHGLGIIHRDLKPANVLVTETGIAKITDFGVAKRLDDHGAFPTLTEQFLGTPSYMARSRPCGSGRPPRRRRAHIHGVMRIRHLQPGGDPL